MEKKPTRNVPLYCVLALLVVLVVLAFLFIILELRTPPASTETKNHSTDNVRVDAPSETKPKETSMQTAEPDTETKAEPEKTKFYTHEMLDYLREEAPAPIIYTGSGDNVIFLDPEELSVFGVWVLYVKGNSTDNYFAVKGWDANDNGTELFVNTTSPYEGITVDLTQTTTQLEITASGEWTVEIRSVFSCDSIDSTAPYTGSGDSFLLIVGEPKTAHIQGNNGKNFFAVKTYGLTDNELLVNTTDAYDGTVKCKGEPLMMEITAENSWCIELQD